MSGFSFEASNHRYLLGALLFIFCHSDSVRRKCLKARLSLSLSFPGSLWTSIAPEKPLMWEVRLKSDFADHIFISSEERCQQWDHNACLLRLLTVLSFSSMLRTPPLSSTGIRLMAKTAARSGGTDMFGPKKT